MAVAVGLAIVTAAQPLSSELLFVFAALVMDVTFTLFTKGFGEIPNRFFHNCSVFPL